MISRPNAALSQIHMQIMWSRLIAVVEEQAQTLMRTAFSTTVREAGDLSAGVFDRDGNMLAQAVTGTPGHVNSMAAAVKHFLDAFPLLRILHHTAARSFKDSTALLLTRLKLGLFGPFSLCQHATPPPRPPALRPPNPQTGFAFQ